MAKKQSKPTRQGGNKYKAIGVRPDDDLRAVIEALAGRERRPLNPMCIILLEEALQARGLWPPPEESKG